MKKTFAYLLFAILLIAFSAVFAACGLLQNGTTTNNYDELHAVYVSYAENGGTLSYNQWLASLQGDKEEIISIAKSETEEGTYVVTYSDGTTSLYSPKTHTNTFSDADAKDGNEQEDNKTDDNGGSISEPDDQNGSGNGGNGSITDPNGNADEGGGNSADQGDSANTGDNTGNENSGEGDDNGNASDGQSGNITDPNGNSGENGSSDETENGDNQGGTTEDPNTGDNGNSGEGDDNGNTSDQSGNGGNASDPNENSGDNGNGDDHGGTTEDPHGNTGDNGSGDAGKGDDNGGDNQGGNEPTPTAPEAPILSVSAAGITWAEVAGATSYSVSLDDGDWRAEPSRSVTFSDIVGEHTLRVRAMNGSLASDSAAFSYGTKALSLSALSTNGLTATWTADGKNVSFTVNGEKAAYDFAAGVYSYTCPATADTYALSVTVSGGYLEDAALYYPVGTRTENETITVSALSAPSLSASFAGIVWAEVTGATSYGVRTDGGIWTEQTTRVLPLLSSTTTHTVEVKALSSDPSRLESAVASYRYETKMLALSDVTRNGLTFSWSATTAEEAMSLTLNGNEATYETTSAAHYRYVLSSAAGDYALRVTVTPSFDENDNVYYYGAEPLEKTANFTISVLSTPILTASAEGVAWAEVTSAASYSVSIDGKTATTQSSRFVALSSATGDHSVTVKALSSDPAFLESLAASYTYETKALALSDIARDGLTFSWTATAAQDRITLTVNNATADYETPAEGSYSHTVESATGTYALRVTASPSFDEENNVYYFAENSIEKTANVTISSLGSPHFSASASGVTWSAVSNAASYSVSIDGGEATTQTSRSVPLSPAAGNHSVTVTAISSDPALTDGASATYTYETKALALSDITRNGLTFSWTATADPSQMSLSLNGTAKNYETTSAEHYSYTIPSSAGTHTLSVRVNPSFAAATRIYYHAAAAIEKEASVTISTLSAPAVSASSEGVSWTAITNAATYKVRREDSGWETVSNLGAALDLGAGEHSVEVKAIPDPADPTLLESPVTAYYYEIKTLTLSDISRTDLEFSWTTNSKPEKMTLTVNDETEDCAAVSLTKYRYTLPSVAGVYTLKVSVEPIFDETNHIYYYSESAIEKTASLTITKLGTPSLTASASGVAWAGITGADAYSVSIDNGAWTEQTDRIVSLSTSVSTHCVRVQAIASDAAVLPGEIASYTYETRAPQLSTLSRNGRIVTWTATTYTPNMTLTRNNTSYPFETLSEGSFRYVIPSETGQHAVSVSASTGFDVENAIYYYTANPTTRTTSVTFSRLAAPFLSASLSGVTWNSVSSASSYKVSVDGGDETSTTLRSVALSNATGNHSVTVKAVSTNDTVLESTAATYSYETKALALSDLSKDALIVSWTATAADDHIFIYKNNESMGTAASSSDVTHSAGGYRYTGIPQAEGSYTIEVTAESSFASNVYYYAANSITKSTTVTVSKLAAPSLTKGDSSISWSAVSHADSYSVYTDSGTASSQTSRSASYSSSTGRHTFYASAVAAEGSAYVSSDKASVSYYTTPVSLSSVTFKGITAHWVASAKSVKVKEDSGSYAVTTLSEYEIKSRTAGSHSVTVQAIGGYDASSNLYYSGSNQTKSAPKTLSLANTTLTFEDQTANSPYSTANGSTDASNWTQEYWNASNESWGETSNQMNSRAGDTSRVVNFSSSTTKNRFTYRGSNSNFGLVNTFSVRIGNYYTAYDIWYKISLIDTDGCVHYLAGATNKFIRSESTGTNNSNKVFKTVSYTGFDPIEVSAIRFEVYGSTGSDSTYCYFYIDDVTLSYVSPDLGSAASYSGGNFTVSAGGSTSKNFSAGYADAMSFTLQNKSGSATAQAVVTLYNGDHMVATGTYVLYSSATQSYTLIFNKWRVTKFTVSASYANVGVSSVSLGTSNTYAVTDNATYRVASTSGSTSILLMGEEVKSSTTINYNLTAIKQLQKYASDVSPLFASIVNVGQILSATYAQSIDVTSNASSTGTYGTLTIKYIESGASSLTTSTITVKRKDSAGLNEATRNAYSRNLWKNISVDPHSVLLAGSSSMEKWETYSQDMKGIEIADVGIGGTVSTDWSKDGGLAERLIYAYNPRAIILFVGVNDLKGGKTVANTLTDVKALIQQIHTKLPNAKVYYVLINKVPLAISGSNQLTESNVTSFNNSMASYANGYNWLTTIALDTTYHMAYSGGSGYDFNYNSTTKAYDKTTYYGKTSFFDSMHLNQAGYTEWAYVIRQKFLALDKKATWSETD